jgi:hypothetical protein
MFDTDFFVAEVVGLKHLLTEEWSEDDHMLHEFEEFEETEQTDCLCDANEFKDRFIKASKRGCFMDLPDWVRY